MATTVRAVAPASPCGHKAETGCILTALPSCCACADRRPMATAYPVYVDGEGMKNSGKRWQMYCWKCRDYHNHQLEASSIYPTSSQQSSSSLESADIAHRGFHQGPGASSLTTSLQERLNSHHISRGTDDRTLSTVLSGLSVNPNRQSVSHDPRPSTQTRRPEQVYPLGTREEVQEEDYQSPIAGMFTRAWTRFRIAEEVRQAERAMNPEAPVFEYNPPQDRPSQTREAHATPTHITHHSAPAVIMPHFHPAVVPSQYAGNSVSAGFNSGTTSMIHTANSYPAAFSQGYPGHPPQFTPHHHPDLGGSNHGLVANPFVRPPHEDEQQQYDEQHEYGDDFDGLQPNAIDRQNRRPEPLKEDQMTANIACKICGEQKIDTLTEPCMHVATCHWCSYLWEREYRSALYNNPNAKHRCVICRRVVKGTRRVWLP